MAIGADLVAQPRAPDQQPDQHAGRHRDQQADIRRRRLGKADADRRQQLVQGGQVHALGETRGRWVHRADRAHQVDQDIVQHRRGDEVEHDRGDHDMAAALGLQIGRDRRPGGPEQRRQPGGPDQRQCPVRPGDIKAHDRHAEPAQHRLALAADVEHAGVKGDRDRQPGEHEVGGVIKCVAPAIGGPQRAGDHQLDRRDRVLADAEDHQRRQRGGQDQADQRDQDHIGPFGHSIHQGAFRREVTAIPRCWRNQR